MDIRALREKAGLTQQELADQTGIPRDRIAKWEQGKGKPKGDDTVTIGNFFSDKIPNSSTSVKTNAKPLGVEVGAYQNKAGNEFIELSDGTYIMTTPLVTKKAYAGYLTGWGDDEYLAELPKHTINVEKPHSGEYISIEIVGQSMNDGTARSFLPGDIATGRKIDRRLWKDSKLHLKTYREFIIVHKNGILLKAITDHNTVQKTITIHSYNPDKDEYPDAVLKLEDVMQIFNVVKNTQNRANKK